MGLFKQKEQTPNEKHFLNVIKNEAPGELLMWKHPVDDFNYGTTLVVAENEQALFVKDGLVEQVFDGGRYTLETDNYPFLSSLRNRLSGNVSSFHCVVYFVRLADSHEIFWGTDTPIQLRDPILGIPVTVQARGAYRFRIGDAKKFFLKMAGNNQIVFTQEGVAQFCRSQFNGKIKSTIGKELRHSNDEILGVCERQDEFAEIISPAVGEFFFDYGLHLANFSISALDVPMNDPYRQKVEMANAERIAMLQTGQAENMLEADRIDQVTGAQGRAFETLGANWGRQKSADILSAVANNPNSGGIAAAGAGFGMGMAAGGAIGSMAQSLFVDPTQPGGTMFDKEPNQTSTRSSGRFMRKGVDAPTTTQNAHAQDRDTARKDGPSACVCPHCGKTVSRSKFCSECGESLMETNYCGQCGAEVAQSMKFCPECGAQRS